MKPCPCASSGRNYPEGDCLGLCTPVQMHEASEDIVPCGCNEIPAPTIPIGGWGWWFPIRSHRPES